MVTAWPDRRRWRQGHRGPQVGEGRGGNADEATGWPVQVEGDQEQQGDECGGEQHREHPAAEDREIEREQTQGDRGACHLQHQDRPWDPVVEAGHADGLQVDHLVEALDVQAWGAGGGRGLQGLSGQGPQLALELLAVGGGLAGRRSAGHRVRQPDAGVGVADQPLQRTGSNGLGQGLGPKIGGADGVGLLDHGSTACLIAPDGQRQPEGQDEPDDAEQGGLEDGQRLPQAVGSVALGPTQQQA